MPHGLERGSILDRQWFWLRLEQELTAEECALLAQLPR